MHSFLEHAVLSVVHDIDWLEQYEYCVEQNAEFPKTYSDKFRTSCILIRIYDNLFRTSR